VTLKVYNISGQKWPVLGGAVYQAGRYAIPFNASRLASGIYFIKLDAQGIEGSGPFSTALKR